MEEKFMRRAIALAKKGTGFTSPNPVVGAVVVCDGLIVGEGWHRRAGMSHAEVIAIAAARKTLGTTDLSGCILYVTLEPCSHYGRTPPCTDLILETGMRQIFVGGEDSFWKVNREGIKRLREAGVRVELVDKRGELFREICLANQSFLKWAQIGLPYVVMKASVTLDGKIATTIGDSKWITGEQTRCDARRERSICDAVLVGAGTVKVDNPELAAHGRYRHKRLLRILIDPLLSSDLRKKIFRDDQIFVATTDKAPARRQRAFRQAGIRQESFGPTEVSLKKLLQYLGKRDITRIFVEGGRGVHGRFHDLALHDQLVVDEVLYYIAPKIFGGEEAISAVGGKGVKHVVGSLTLHDIDIKRIGTDIRLRGYVNFYS